MRKKKDLSKFLPTLKDGVSLGHLMKKKVIINKEDYIKIQKKLNREIELERNGGRWVAVDRVHESKKAYNRKRNKKINLDNSYSFFF